MTARAVVLAGTALLALVWIGVTIWVRHNFPPGLDLSSFHAIGIVLIVPAALLGLWGRRLQTALGLLGVAAAL